jgi:hypothetical protein
MGERGHRGQGRKWKIHPTRRKATGTMIRGGMVGARPLRCVVSRTCCKPVTGRILGVLLCNRAVLRAFVL